MPIPSTLESDLRARLEQLNRQPLDRRGGSPPRRVVQAEQKSTTAGEILAEGGASPSPAVGPRPTSDFAGEAAATGLAAGVEVENAAGRFLRIDRPLFDLWPGGQLLHGHTDWPAPEAYEPAALAHEDAVLHVETPRLRWRAEFAALARNFPRGTLFLDLETCGLSGSMVFLVGLVCWIDGRLVLRQLLSRTYAEERAMLAALWPLVAAHPVLCTFNGKTFDWPMVQDRSTLHRLGRPPRRTAAPARAATAAALRPGPSSASSNPGPELLGPRDPRPQPLHCDLLHHARRRWRAALPNCRLQTLETFICRRRRSGDIPGSEIPLAYHQFVRTGEPRRLESILHHNALDLLTLVQLADRML